MNSINLIFFVPHNVFEGNTYKHILTGVDVVSRYKLLKLLGPRKQVRFHLCWKQYIRRVVCLNTQRYSNTIIGLILKVIWQSCLKNTVLTFEEHCGFQVSQELQGSAKLSAIWVKNLNSTVNKMSNTKSSMIGSKKK